MGQAEWTAVLVVIVSAVLQILKDHFPWSKTALPWVAAVLGALTTGAQAALGNGGIDTGTAGVAAVGGAATVGVHQLLLQNKWLGAILKNLGAGIFKGTAT